MGRGGLNPSSRWADFYPMELGFFLPTISVVLGLYTALLHGWIYRRGGAIPYTCG